MLHKKILIIATIAFAQSHAEEHTPFYFCTAADDRFFDHLRNLIGSIHATNFDDLGEIAIYDLGLTPQQKKELETMAKVSVRRIERRHPEMLTPFPTRPIQSNWGPKLVRGWYSWKLVAIKQALDMFPYVVWVDAGTTVLKPLGPLFSYVKNAGYFLTTWGDPRNSGPLDCPIKWGTTKFVRDYFKLDKPDRKWILEQEIVMAGFLGLSRSSPVYSSFFLPLYQLTSDLRYFKDDGTTPNGFGTGRHDQPLVSIMAYLHDLKIHKQDPLQEHPIVLSTTSPGASFYITWAHNKVDSKTHIFNSRDHLEKLPFYVSKIRHKENSNGHQGTTKPQRPSHGSQRPKQNPKQPNQVHQKTNHGFQKPKQNQHGKLQRPQKIGVRPLKK